MLSNLFYFVLTLSVLVTFHEYGHFWVARKCGVRVLRFSVGFGRPLFRWLGADGTEYVIAAIPLGGYVKMLDSREREISAASDDSRQDNSPQNDLSMSESSQAFDRKSAGARATIIAAGPVANFLLAALVYALVYMLGVPGYKPLVGDVASASIAEQAGLREGQIIVAIDNREVQSRADVSERLLKRLGDTGDIKVTVLEPGSTTAVTLFMPVERWLSDSETPNPYSYLGFSYWFPEIEPVVERVLEGEPADAAGMQAGDRLVSIDGVAIQTWEDATQVISAIPGQRVLFEVERVGKRDAVIERHSLWVKVAEQELDGEREGRIGVAARMPDMPGDLKVVQHYGLIEASIKGVNKTVEVIAFTLDSVKKMLVGLISPTHLGGPVTIATIASMSAESGLVAYLQMLALLSVSLGVFNLLPIPVLDGGHLLIIAVESLTGRPLPEKLLMSVQQVGLVLLLSIMAFAIYNDIARL